MWRLRVEEVKVPLVADVHAGDEDATSPGRLLGIVPRMHPPVSELLLARRLLPSEEANQQVQENAPLRETNYNIERAIVYDPIRPILDCLLHLFVLDPRRRVELLVPIEARSFDASL